MDRRRPPTLPDLLRDGLTVLFVGINPSLYSAAKGHYFARPGNRFWPSFSASRLSLAARRALATSALQPEHDRLLLAHGFGFTDVVKGATTKASEVEERQFADGVAKLRAKLEQYAPDFACFLGITGYRRFHAVIARSGSEPVLGLQEARLARTRLFVVPSPSGANAHSSRAELMGWFDALAEGVDGA